MEENPRPSCQKYQEKRQTVENKNEMLRVILKYNSIRCCKLDQPSYCVLWCWIADGYGACYPCSCLNHYYSSHASHVTFSAENVCWGSTHNGPGRLSDSLYRISLFIDSIFPLFLLYQRSVFQVVAENRLMDVNSASWLYLYMLPIILQCMYVVHMFHQWHNIGMLSWLLH